MAHLSRTSRLLAALAAVVCAIGPALAGDRDAREPRRAAQEIQGTLKKLDAKVGTISINIGRDSPKDRDLNLLETVTVEIDGKPAKLDALAEGMLVFLKVNETTGDVAAIRAEGQTLHGKLKEVDADKQRIVLANERQSPSYPVTTATRITVDGREAKLADLQPGTPAALKMSADGKTLVAIMAGQGLEERGGERRPEAPAPGRGERRPEGPVPVQGHLKSLDAKARTLILTTQRERQEVELTFTLAPDAVVHQGRVQVALDELKPGARLALILGEDKKTVTSIHFLPEERGGRRPEVRGEEGRRGGLQLRGAIKAIDPAGKTLTLTVNEGGIELTGVFTFTDTTAVHKGREAAQLGDLKAGVPVVLHFAEDKKTLVSVHIIPTER